MHPKTAVAVDVGLLLAPPLPTRLLSVLRDKTREESKTVEDFLKSLENGHKALANVLKHRNNQGKWAYLRQVWSGSALAPSPTPTVILFLLQQQCDRSGGLWLVGPIIAVQSVSEALRLQAECACKTSNTLCPLLD